MDNEAHHPDGHISTITMVPYHFNQVIATQNREGVSRFDLLTGSLSQIEMQCLKKDDRVPVEQIEHGYQDDAPHRDSDK